MSTFTVNVKTKGCRSQITFHYCTAKEPHVALTASVMMSSIELNSPTLLLLLEEKIPLKISREFNKNQLSRV